RATCSHSTLSPRLRRGPLFGPISYLAGSVRGLSAGPLGVTSALYGRIHTRACKARGVCHRASPSGETDSPARRSRVLGAVCGLGEPASVRRVLPGRNVGGASAATRSHDPIGPRGGGRASLLLRRP